MSGDLAHRRIVAILQLESVGVGEAILNLEVIDTGSSVTREVWLNVAGTSVTNMLSSSSFNYTVSPRR